MYEQNINTIESDKLNFMFHQNKIYNNRNKYKDLLIYHIIIYKYIKEHIGLLDKKTNTALTLEPKHTIKIKQEQTSPTSTYTLGLKFYLYRTEAKRCHKAIRQSCHSLNLDPLYVSNIICKKLSTFLSSDVNDSKFETISRVFLTHSTAISGYTEFAAIEGLEHLFTYKRILKDLTN
jgi:hypothetical protein